MSGPTQELEAVRVGDRWRHVGGGGVPATGLLVEVTELGRGTQGPYFLVVYPELHDFKPRKYSGTALGPRYVLEN